MLVSFIRVGVLAATTYASVENFDRAMLAIEQHKALIAAVQARADRMYGGMADLGSQEEEAAAELLLQLRPRARSPP